jgi:beta-galactosidase GanA
MGVEITKRSQGNQSIHFVLNFTDSAQRINLPSAQRNLLDNTVVSGVIQIPASDVLILVEQPGL